MKRLMLVFALLFSVAFAQSVSFTLRNNTLTSIPLVIPSVMNPNLTPMGNSGVDLEVGQEVFFVYQRKKYLLLKVTPDLKGQTLMVGDLIRDRKKELGLN
jgi:hypothetical protein